MKITIEIIDLSIQDMCRFKWVSISISALLGAFTSLLGQDPIQIEKGFSAQNITPYGAIYFDNTQSENIGDIISIQPEDFSALSLPYIQQKRKKGKNVWIRFEINHTINQDKDYRLSLSSDALTIHYFQVDSTRVVIAESKAGRSITPIKHKSGALPPAFLINLKSNSKTFIYLMMDSDDLFYEKIILKSIPKYQRDLSIRTFTEGAIHGLLLIATIIAFVLFLITRLSINLYYFLFVAVNTFSLHIALGYFNYLFFPEFAFGHFAQFAAVLVSSILFFKFILTYYEGYGLSQNLNMPFGYILYQSFYFLS